MGESIEDLDLVLMENGKEAALQERLMPWFREDTKVYDRRPKKP